MNEELVLFYTMLVGLFVSVMLAVAGIGVALLWGWVALPLIVFGAAGTVGSYYWFVLAV